MKLLRRLAVAALVLIAVDQLCLRTLLREDTFLGRPVAPFDPPLFSPPQEESLARIDAFVETGERTAESFSFDPELGWCPPANGGSGEYTYDWAGARIASGPLAETKAGRRIVTVGCSMTHGEESPAEETWAARVDAALADTDVANLGVAAYGLDQALMRLRRDGFPLEPDEVWMGLLPEAAFRVTTLYRPVLRHWSLGVAFKPRFTVRDGELVEIPCPVGSLAEVSRLLHDQTAFLDAMGDGDPWIERARAAYLPRGSHWAHHSFVGRLALTALEGSGRDLPAALADPESEVRRLITAIARSAAEETAARGARFRFLVLPGRRDLEDVRANGRGYWAELTGELERLGVEVVDLTPVLVDESLDGLFQPHGHYTPAANERVAQEMVRRLGLEGSPPR